MATTYQLLTLFAWLAIMSSTSGKPVKQDDSITSLLGDNISLDIQEKAEAIDNLLRLLSEINLPSICDALAAKKNSVNQNVKSVDAILAQAARSQAMTFIPTNLPETRDVTRPGDAPVSFLNAKKKFPARKHFKNGKVKRIFLGRDKKQASREVAVSKSEGPMGGISLDNAASIHSKNQNNGNGKSSPIDINVDVSLKAMTNKKFQKNTSTTMTASSPSSTARTTSTTAIPTTEASPSTPKPIHTTPRPASHSTTTTKSTTTSPKSTKKDTTIPTLSSDMMLPSDGSFESGDGEITVDGTADATMTTEKYTTSRLEDEAFTTRVTPTFDSMLKNIFKFNDDKDLDLAGIKPTDTDVPIHELDKMVGVMKPTTVDDSNDTKGTPLQSLPTTAYLTPYNMNTEEDLEDLFKGDPFAMPSPTADEDNSWTYTLPSNTTMAEFIFGNQTLNDDYSDDLASILNSTLPLDYLISNDTLYNEFMSILNETLSHNEFVKQSNFSIDLSVNETTDYQNLVDYLSNMTNMILPTDQNFTDSPDSTAYHTTEVRDLLQDENKTTVEQHKTTVEQHKITLKSSAKPTVTTFTARVNNIDPKSRTTYKAQPKIDTTFSKIESKVTTINNASPKATTFTRESNARVTDPARFEYADSSAPQYSGVEREVEQGGHSHIHPKETDFAAGDYYSNEDDDRKTLSEIHDTYPSQKEYKHSGFAPVNSNRQYKQDARHSGLTYLGFDFKQINRSPYTPKAENTEVAQLVNQKTIWSEPTRQTEKHVTSPAGYSCPGLFGYYGDAHDCKSFFICSWGVPYRFHCPPGTMWSSAESVCDWDRNVVCHENK